MPRGAVNQIFLMTVFDVVFSGRVRPSPHAATGQRGSQNHRPSGASDEMKLTELADRQISELSGGQKQRVFIARALAQRAISAIDEPLAGVDDDGTRIVAYKFVALQKAGKTVIAVHYDLPRSTITDTPSSQTARQGSAAT